MYNARWSLSAALALQACKIVAPAAATSSAAATRPVAALDGTALKSLAGVRVSLRAPTRALYDSQALGIAGQFVTLRLENTGPRSVPLPRLRTFFASSRDGVTFPCNEHPSDAAGAVEPSGLDPGQSFDFERLLDCRMPLPGLYDVRVWLDSTGRATESSGAVEGEYIGAFEIEVVAHSGTAPRPVPTQGGLYAIMVGARTAPPVTAEAWARGAYQVTVALINGGAEPLTLAPVRLSLLLFKKGAPNPCSHGSELLDAPARLPPGALHVVHVPVRCAPAGEGRYQVVGKLLLPGADGMEIGRIGLQVTEYLYLFDPEPPAEQ